MDCEKYEPLLIEELYGELDEVTSAAVKRHVTGCARCGAILAGMKTTRRAFAPLPMEEPPPDMEARILAAVKEAQKVVPLERPMSRALSAAGRWAMRPQNAMAAVFLLMIGTSAFVLRANKRAPTTAMSVTEQGAPAVTAVASADRSGLDDRAAATAHGTPPPPPAVVAMAT